MGIYLDHNATSPLDVRVLAAMQPWLAGVQGNPASVHRFGRSAHDALEQARAQVAALINVQASQVVFTGGGTEANNLALKGVCHGAPAGALVVSAIEHAAVLGPAQALAAQGWALDFMPVDSEGRYDLAGLERLLQKRSVRLVSAMLANNETGVIEDVGAMSERAHAYGALAHTDAVQAAGKLQIDFTQIGVDLMTLAAHKLNGPRGVGALIMDRRVDLMPLLHGGGQEQGLRGGTENLAGIVGFGAAAELVRTELDARRRLNHVLRERLEAGLVQIPGLRIFSASAERLCNTVQFGVEGFDGEWLVMELDKRGLAVSSGSACHSRSGRPSHVLLAMGLDEDTARGAVRVSFGQGNIQQDADAVCAAVTDITAVARRHAAAMGG
jgi:cysteine desulfurase